jgi:MFS family permease
VLFAGRLADLYPPHLVYTAGFVGLAIFSLIISFMNDQYAFFVLRAISGLVAVLTIPSSINMIGEYSSVVIFKSTPWDTVGPR